MAKSSQAFPRHFSLSWHTTRAKRLRRRLKLKGGTLSPQLLDHRLRPRKYRKEQTANRFRTASACGFTPLSIIWMQVASVSLSSLVFKSCEMSYRAVAAQLDPGSYLGRICSLSNVSLAEMICSDSLADDIMGEVMMSTRSPASPALGSVSSRPSSLPHRHVQKVAISTPGLSGPPRSSPHWV